MNKKDEIKDLNAVSYTHLVLSNESSANDSYVKERYVNHQYSKSLEFENDFRKYTAEFLSDKIEYFSLLRCMNAVSYTHLDVYKRQDIGVITMTKKAAFTTFSPDTMTPIQEDL